MLREIITDEIKNSIRPKEEILNGEVMDSLIAAGELIQRTVGAHQAILWIGNGGSASDAIHMSAELTGRFRRERTPYPSFALSENVSAITAIANDYTYEDVFSRQVRAYAPVSGLVIGLSTSGNSTNVINAIVVAKTLGLFTIALTGSHGGKLAGLADVSIRVPSSDTAHIQESHFMIGHIFSEIAERAIMDSE